MLIEATVQGEVPDHRQGCEHSVGSDSPRPPTSSLDEVGKTGRRAGDEEENRRWSCWWDELVPRGRGEGSTQGMYYVSLAVGWEPQTGTRCISRIPKGKRDHLAVASMA